MNQTTSLPHECGMAQSTAIIANQQQEDTTTGSSVESDTSQSFTSEEHESSLPVVLFGHPGALRRQELGLQLDSGRGNSSLAGICHPTLPAAVREAGSHFASCARATFVYLMVV